MNTIHKLTMIIVAIFAINIQMSYAQQVGQLRYNDGPTTVQATTHINEHGLLTLDATHFTYNADASITEDRSTSTIVDLASQAELNAAQKDINNARIEQEESMMSIASFVAGNTAMSTAFAGGDGIGFGIGANEYGTAGAIGVTKSFGKHTFSLGGSSAGQISAGYKFKF